MGGHTLPSCSFYYSHRSIKIEKKKISLSVEEKQKRKGSVWMMNGPGLYAKRHNLTYTITKETKMYSCNSVISLSHRFLDERENLAIRN
jgi:hypothetical protein